MRRRLLGPALMALMVLVMLAILIGLGTWQVYRLHWKEGVLARIAAAEQAPPIPLGPNPEHFTRIAISGRFRFDLAASFGAEVRDTAEGPVMGTYQVVPLIRDDGPPILVERGWLPETRKTPPDNPNGTVTVVGYVRPTEGQHWFSPTDDPATRRFYTLNTATIGAAMGLPTVMPFTVIALGPVGTNVPIPAQSLPRPPNNHLSYAVTWYGLALVLVVIFFSWARKSART